MERGGGKGAAAVKKALGRYDSHVNVLKVCDNGLLQRLSKGGRGKITICI